MTTHAPTQAVRTLMVGLIDYAGLFPPASLDMQPTVETFARDRMGEHEWMLGRLICPATRLEELSEHAAMLMPGTFATSGYRERADAGEPWRVSVIAATELAECLDAIAAAHARQEPEAHGRGVRGAGRGSGRRSCSGPGCIMGESRTSEAERRVRRRARQGGKHGPE